MEGWQWQRECLRGGRGRRAAPDGRLRTAWGEKPGEPPSGFLHRSLREWRGRLCWQGRGRQVDEEWHWALSAHTFWEHFRSTEGNKMGCHGLWLPWSSTDQVHPFPPPAPAASRRHSPCYTRPHAHVPVWVCTFVVLQWNKINKAIFMRSLGEKVVEPTPDPQRGQGSGLWPQSSSTSILLPLLWMSFKDGLQK